MFEDMGKVVNPRLALGMILFFVAALTVRFAIIGNTKLVHLGSAPALAGQISQALGPNSVDGSLRKDGSDYTINPRYFEKNNWAVVNITAKGNTFQSGFAVMKKNSGVYQVVLGPGTSIASTQLAVLPVDVAVYIQTHEAVYNPVPGQ